MRKRAAGLIIFTVLLTVAYIAAQTQETQAANFRRMSLEAETRGLAEPFKGVTTNGTPQTGLYSLRSTGVSTEPVRKAAVAFLAKLSEDQRKRTTFPIDDLEWRKWMNQDFYIRQGVG